MFRGILAPLRVPFDSKFVGMMATSSGLRGFVPETTEEVR